MKRSRSGFTLIELVASAVLAALMTVGLMNVVWSTVRESQQLRRSEIIDFPVTQLAERMRTDFQNARGMALQASGVTLHGFLATNRSSREPQLIPGRVRYVRRNIADRGVLVRSEFGGASEAVWFGFGRLQVEPLTDVQSEDALLPVPETGGLPEMPPIFRVTLLGDDKKILWREVIHHHE